MFYLLNFHFHLVYGVQRVPCGKLVLLYKVPKEQVPISLKNPPQYGTVLRKNLPVVNFFAILPPGSASVMWIRIQEVFHSRFSITHHWKSINAIIHPRAVDQHSFFADPYPAVLLNADPDPEA